MLTKLTDRRALRRWTRAARTVDQLDMHDLHDLQHQAKRLSRRLSDVMNAAQHRLDTFTAPPANALPPTHSDWHWRPALWSHRLDPNGLAQIASETRLSRDTALFHDCPRAEISLRQVIDTCRASAPAYATIVETLGFDGSYLSLAIDLPAPCLDGLDQHHIIGLTLALKTERPVQAYARLNLRHGPNVAHLICAADHNTALQALEFDLSTAQLDPSRLTKAWVDLIFERPAHNHLTVSQMAFHRRPRAEV